MKHRFESIKVFKKYQSGPIQQRINIKMSSVVHKKKSFSAKKKTQIYIEVTLKSFTKTFLFFKDIANRKLMTKREHQLFCENRNTNVQKSKV